MSEENQQLKQLRQDVLSLLDMDNFQVDIYTKKNLLKGIINNFLIIWKIFRIIENFVIERRAKPDAAIFFNRDCFADARNDNISSC